MDDAIVRTGQRKALKKIRRGLLALVIGSVGIFLVPKVTAMVLNEAAQRLGVSLRQTEDQLTRDMLASTASFINCTGGVNGDNPTEVTRFDVDQVVQTLMSNNAYTISDHIEGKQFLALVKFLLIDLEGYGNAEAA